MSLRSAWQASALPAVIVPAATGAAAAAELRARFEATGYRRFTGIDRASYDQLASIDEPALFEALTGVASEVTGRPLRVVDARVMRLGPGDYVLARHDRAQDGRPVEIVLDLSPATTPGAEMHWRHRGQVFFAMPATPGDLALVERGPTVTSNQTYVSKRYPEASVVRLILLLTT